MTTIKVNGKTITIANKSSEALSLESLSLESLSKDSTELDNISKTIVLYDGNVTVSLESSNSVNDSSDESLDLTKVKYKTGRDAYGANVSKETINFLSKNKDKLKEMFLEAALSYYKESTYGDFAEEEIGKKIKDCTTADMDSLIHGPFKILEDSSIRSYRKSDFVITAENKLDPEHGIAVGFSKSPLKVVETGDIGYFL